MADVFGAPHKERSRETVVAQAKSTQGKTADTQGATIYAAACAGCHESDRPPPYGGINFALSSALSAPDPRNLINIVLAGVRPVEGERSPIMPGFAVTMNDRQIAVLVNYLRSRFTGQPAWSGLETVIEQARRTQTAYLTTSAGPAGAPAGVAQRDKP
jgi:mono/diheme cytochrome c family protein